MKKFIIKTAVFLAVFVASLFVFSKIMNQDHDNLTMEMAQATLPVVTMEINGIPYNRLFGYTEQRDVKFHRETVAVLGENRSSEILVDTYGSQVSGISMQVRSLDGSRLIEDSPVTDYQETDGFIRAGIALKDLIERDKEYSLTLVLELADGRDVYYYTGVIWSDSLAVDEKLAYVLDFHDKTFRPEEASELTRYLETNSKLEDNSSFHKVNIHSSLKQITWDGLGVTEVGEPVLQLVSIEGQTASILVDYMVSTESGGDVTYYQVQEYFRVRHTSERMYLLDYERTMDQIPDEKRMYANDKILLGIADENVPMLESEDGNVVVFEMAGRLCCYNATSNSLIVLFSFYDEENWDDRTLRKDHDLKILDVDEGGNIRFAVYGYMNRGRHEGEVGIQLYTYNSMVNTIEEMVFINYDKNFDVLATELEQLLYLNREDILYLKLENTIYQVNLMEKTYKELVTVIGDDSLFVSGDHKIAVWQEGADQYHSRQLTVMNLNTGTQSVIKAGENEVVRPLGFMGEDLIYGVARNEDIREEVNGSIFFPMYKVCICNSAGEILKKYENPGIYIEECSVENNQITLERLVRKDNGSFEETMPDHIMNNVETATGKNTVATAVIDGYKKYVQIKTKKVIDSDTIKILTPKEVVYEGGRELELVQENTFSRFYVYGPYGVMSIYNNPGAAVAESYDIAGRVMDDKGICLWRKGTRVAKNQIMAIKEAKITEEKDSVAVCLDTMLEFEGVIRDSNQLLQGGMTVTEILADSLPDAQVLDLAGCKLDAVLYYVNRDIPVLAMLENGEAVLVTGFNEFNVVVMDPSKGTLGKVGMNDATTWFAENGNRFVTYMPYE